MTETLTTREAATLARVTVDTIRHWARYGAIRATKKAGRWVIDQVSLLRRIELDRPRYHVTDYGTAYTIAYALAPYPGELVDLHRFQAVTPTGEVISELYVDPVTWVIASVQTEPEYRGEGIATSLYHAALAQLPQVLHDLPEHRTEDGNGWAEHVGGETVEAEELFA
mgnify:CR=1 FL=1